MRPPTILCADSERNVLLTLRVQLQRCFPHCAVEIAESSSEVLEVVEALLADGVEVPLVIAGLDGLAPQGVPVLIELYRRHPNIAKVLLVGQATVEDLVNLVNQGGVYRCLKTPWKEADLQETVGSALQHYQQQQHLIQASQEQAALRKQSQQCGQERQQAQQQLRLFVEHAPAAIAMFDRDMRYILASQRWKTDYDLGEQPIIGRSHYEVFPEIPDRWKAIHQRCLAGATERSEEDYFVRVDGSTTWNQWEIHPWYTDAGEIGGIIMFTQVFTDRKLAQLALQESEERNRAILSAVPDIMTIISADGRYLDIAFNQFAGELLPPRLNGHVTEVLPPEAAQLCLKTIQQVLQTGKPQTYEHQIPLGERIQYEEVRIVPYQTDKVLCMVHDVTERKQAEILLKESERRLSLALSAAKAGVWEWDMTTHRTYWSDENFRLMGYEPGSVETTYDIWLQAVHPEDQTWANDYVSRVTADDRDLNLEYRVLLPDGSVRWLHDIGQIVKDVQGQPIGMNGIQIDVTARKQIELEIVQSRDLREAIFNESADALFLVDPQTLLTLDCNQRAVEMFEADSKVVLINIAGHTLQRCQFSPAELEEIAAEISAQSFWSREIEYVTLQGKPFWGNIAAKRIHVAGQALNLVRVTDISTRKQAEAQLETQNALLARIAQGAPLCEILHGVIIQIEQRVPGAMGSVLLLDEADCLRHGAAPNLPLNYIQAVDGVRIGNGIGSCGTAAYTKQVVVVGEIDTDPCWRNYREFALAHGLRACWSIPLIAADGKVLGTFGLYYAEPRWPRGNELAQISQIANLAGIAIERDRAAAQIRRSEEQLKLALDFTGIGAWSWNPTTDEYVWTQQMVQLLEIPVGLSNMFQLWCDRIHPNDLSRVQTSIQTALATKTSFAEEYRYRLQDGRWVWRWFKGQGIYTETGEVERVLGIVQDITERKQAEQALQQLNEELELRVQQRTQDLLASQAEVQAKEQFLRGVFEGTDNPLFVVDVLENGSFKFTGWNRASELISGVSSAEALGKSPQAVFPGAVGAAIADNYQRCCNQGQMIRYEEYLVFEEGDAWTLTTLTPLKDAQGQIYRMIGSVFDITNRKRAEKMLQQQLAAIEASSEGIAIANAQGEYTYLNQAHVQIFGYDHASELIGKTWRELYRTADIDQIEQTVFPVLAQQSVWQGEMTAKRKDGSLFFEDLSLTLLSDGRIVCVCRDISDRKQTEIELLEAQRFAQRVADNTPNIIYIYDLEADRNIYTNREVFEVLGYTPETIQAMGNALLETVIHPDDFAWCMQHYRQIAELADGEVLEVEYRVRHANGTWRWLSDRISVFKRNKAGDVIQYIGAAQDITSRKQAEAALAEKNTILRSVIECTPDVVYVKDAAGRYVIVNSGFANFFGQPAEQLLGKTDVELLPAETAAQIAENDRRTIESGVPQTIEETVPRPDGNSRVYLTTKAPWHIPPGDQIGIVGLAQDITERKQAEQALFESEQRYATLAAAAPVGIYCTNVQGECLYVNERWCNIAGLSEVEAMGMGWLNALHPDDCAMILQAWNQFVQIGDRFRLEYRFQRPDGTITWVFGQAVPERDENGIVKGYVGTITDISDRKRLEQDLLQINAELEQRVIDRTQDLQYAVEAAQTANRAKSTFLANMSHELRTPLNAILGFSQLLNRDSHLTPDQQEQVNIINRSGEHLLSLINNVLAMSKIEAGRTTLTLSCFNLQELLQDLEELFRLKANAKQLTLTVQIAATVPLWIQTDESKLRQVLINLISNAIKFTEQGSVTVRVWSESHPNFPTDDAESLDLHFEVEDTGLGIGLDEQDKVFQPFEQTQSGRNSQEGTGLGMSISRQFVQLMQGELGFESRLHQGTTFYFTIPVQPVETGGHQSKPQMTQVIGLASDQPTYRLLVVEDNADNRQFLVQLLRSVGFEVQPTVNGQEAVNLWQTWAPHLIWMDLRMPVMNGYDATRQIRLLEQQTEYQTSDRPIAKILALTASAFEDDREAILAAGCDDFLFKPVTEAILFEKMAHHLGVCYRYQEQWILPVPPAATSDQAWIVQALQQMPLDWIAQLHYAARIADEDLMLRILNQLPPTEVDLVTALKELVTAFEIEKLIELTEYANDVD